MQLELQHIYLEVYNERFHNLKEYCEAYYCYKHNLVTRHGKPDWLGIFTTANYSLKAQQCSNRKLLSRDLWLPMTVIIGQLKAFVRQSCNHCQYSRFTGCSIRLRNCNSRRI